MIEERTLYVWLSFSLAVAAAGVAATAVPWWLLIGTGLFMFAFTVARASLFGIKADETWHE